jgi:hypothetical protein
MPAASLFAMFLAVLKCSTEINKTWINESLIDFRAVLLIISPNI